MTEPNDDTTAPVDCERAASLLLEADAEELRGAGDGPLAGHLRTCDACRGVASRITAAEARLSHALDERSSRVGVEEMLGRLGRELEGEGRPAVATTFFGRRPRLRPEPRGRPRRDSVAHPRRDSVTRPRWRKWVAPLAAAAIVAALLVRGTRPDAGQEAPTPPIAVTAPPDTQPEGLRVEADRRFALMKTDRPTISVVWFY